MDQENILNAKIMVNSGLVGEAADNVLTVIVISEIRPVYATVLEC